MEDKRNVCWNAKRIAKGDLHAYQVGKEHVVGRRIAGCIWKEGHDTHDDLKKAQSMFNLFRFATISLLTLQTTLCLHIPILNFESDRCINTLHTS